MKKGVRNLLLFILLLPILLGSATSARYKTLADQSFYVMEASDVATIYRPKGSTYKADFVEAEYGLAEQYLEQFAHYNNLPMERCKNSDLQVFVVGMDIVNDKERYPYTTNNVSERWAIYDPYPQDNNLSVILLTEHTSTNVDTVLLVHELGHYWFDEYCWSDDWKASTESFAMSFQDFYTLDRFNRRF